MLVAKLSDFGLAKSFGAAGCTQATITRDQGVCGTPHYMAPEHVTLYKYVEPPTDVFEMAATMTHILTGKTVRPIKRGQDPFKVVLEVRPRPFKELMPKCSEAFAEVMDTALAWDAKDRYQDGRAFLDAMKQVL